MEKREQGNGEKWRPFSDWTELNELEENKRERNSK